MAPELVPVQSFVAIPTDEIVEDLFRQPRERLDVPVVLPLHVIALARVAGDGRPPVLVVF